MRLAGRMTMLTAVLISALGFSVVSPAATEIVTVEAEGAGVDREEAVFAALTAALGSVAGIEIVSEQTRGASSRELVVRSESGSQGKIVFDRNSSQSIRSATEGFIDSYRIISSTDRGSQIVVRLAADIATFATPGSASQDTRRRLAVYPTQSSGTYRFLGERVSGGEAGRLLTQKLVEAMTGTRRFAVLERERTRAIERELDFLLDPSTARGEATRIGQAVGADYLLTTQINDMNVTAEREVSRLTSEVQTKWSGAMTVEVRIISLATRQIMWADTESLQGPAISRLAGADAASSVGISAALGIIADRITAKAVDAIYPMRLVSTSPDGQVVINQGSNRLAPGDELAVYRLGRHLKDPYSGESLGREETFVGTVEVTRVTSKVGYAQLSTSVNGGIRDEDAQSDFVLRKDGF